MADDRNNLVVGYPTREIRVTGERCASMVHTTVAVSRFEIQLVNMSMSSANNMRDAVRKSSDRFKRALDAFESEIRECQRDLDLASKRKRPANRKPSGGSVQRPGQEQVGRHEAKQQASAAAQNTPASHPSKAAPNQQGKTPAAHKQPQKTTEAQPDAGAKQPQKQKQRQKQAKQLPAAEPGAGVKNQTAMASPDESKPKAVPAVPVLD
ncbi:hypothetical protein QAO71_17180 (plasmid) [Halopseudomonas sp. SMJS2]|uniref:hypothetical protein n=1 Tax=Halopseudomonas sp. SMJS2 TaxID=3041098 RepID=UPI002452E2ED|nr:hypothetical protein [Halopseudomonas sp. SMJS2]WGK63501.1 hypothetical protein QAO71_17180 [Halopseudomonas sp. SMJS2]